MMHHINNVDHPGHHSHRTMADNLETADPGRILTSMDSGEYDNVLYGSQDKMELTPGTGADGSAPPPLLPRSPTCQPTTAPVQQTERPETTHAQFFAQGQRQYPGHAQLQPTGALQASGADGYCGNECFQGQQPSQESKTKTAMEVYLESQQTGIHATQVDACSANVSIRNRHVNQSAGKIILDQNRTDVAAGHVTSDSAHDCVQSTAHHTPLQAKPVRYQYVIHFRKTHPQGISSTPGVQQGILTFPKCPGQVGATGASCNPHIETFETNMQTSVQSTDYDPPSYQCGEETRWPPAPPNGPRPVQSPVRRASGCRGIPGDQIMHNPTHTGAVASQQAVPRSQGTQCDSISHNDQTEPLHLSPEQQPVDEEPKYDFPRNAGVGSPARREYGYRWEIDGRQELRSPENVGDMAAEQAQYRSPQCRILPPGDQREELRVSLERQTVHREPQYDFIRDSEGGAPVRTANEYREQLLQGKEVHQPEHVRDIVSDQEHHKSQSAQCRITLSTDRKEELHTEPLYDFIKDENVSSMKETGKPTDQQHDIALVMQGPSSTTDKNNVTKAPPTWECHCGNVNLIGNECLACQEMKEKGLREPEKSNNFCIQESEDTVPSPDVWQCKHCTYFNPMAERICEACAKTKDFLLEDEAPETQSVQINEESHVEDDSEDGLDNTEKKCPECDFVNLAEAELCISCACELPKAEDKQLSEPAGGVDGVSQDGRRCQFCTYDNTIDAKICQMCSRTLDEVSESKTRDRNEEATYKTCKNCGKLIKITEDICYYCRCGGFVPNHIPVEQEQGQMRNEIDQNEKKTPFQQFKSFFGFGKSRKEEGGAVFYDNDGLPCQHCTYKNSQNAEICEMCEIPIHEAAPMETSLKPPDKIFISKGVSISGEDFVKYLKAGEEHGFKQGQVIWALRNCGAKDPIRYLQNWRENRQRREKEAQAAQDAAYQAAVSRAAVNRAPAYPHPYGPAGVVHYPVQTHIIYYP